MEGGEKVATESPRPRNLRVSKGLIQVTSDIKKLTVHDLNFVINQGFDKVNKKPLHSPPPCVDYKCRRIPRLCFQYTVEISKNKNGESA